MKVSEVWTNPYPLQDYPVFEFLPRTKFQEAQCVDKEIYGSNYYITFIVTGINEEIYSSCQKISQI